MHIKTPKNADRSEGMWRFYSSSFSKSRCFTCSNKKRRVSKTSLFWSRCHERFLGVLVWMINKNAPKRMGRLFKRVLAQTALLSKKWASSILNKRVNFIKSMSFLNWFLALLTLFTKNKCWDKKFSLIEDSLECSFKLRLYNRPYAFANEYSKAWMRSISRPLYPKYTKLILFLVILGRIGDISFKIKGNKIINRDLQYI